jgi:hypothetical protein
MIWLGMLAYLIVLLVGGQLHAWDLDARRTT